MSRVMCLFSHTAYFYHFFLLWLACPSEEIPKLILISFDGFGWNYIDKLPKSRLPNFHNFIDNGVQVKWIENVFPTLTRPNHMSMVSGLFTESHGIIDNYFYDPTLNYFIPGSRNLGKKDNDSKMVDVGAEPIWVTNSKVAHRQSGCILWPNAEVKIKGRMPEEIKKGEWSVSENEFSARERINLALEWLTRPENPVNFVAVYFPEPDETSHTYGPDSQEVVDVILRRDSNINYLMNQIKQIGLADSLNVIITSDHGQLTLNKEFTINIDLLVNPKWYASSNSLDTAPMASIWPKNGYLDKLVSGLQHARLNVSTKENKKLLDLHYFNNKRTAPIVLTADSGWVIITNRTALGFKSKGQHGWDPRYSKDMYPFFIATGPAFKKGLKDAAPFHIVDIYPLMCYILGLQPAPNNGSLEKTRHILAERPPPSSCSIDKPPAPKSGSVKGVRYTLPGCGVKNGGSQLAAIQFVEHFCWYCFWTKLFIPGILTV